jgi:phytoene synthase
MDQVTALKACRALQAKHGKSYYFATRLFPKPLREATYVLYAFFRVPDEIVDTTSQSPEQAAAALEEFRKNWREAYQKKYSENPILFAAQHVFHQYRIPPEYAEIFWMPWCKIPGNLTTPIMPNSKNTCMVQLRWSA